MKNKINEFIDSIEYGEHSSIPLSYAVHLKYGMTEDNIHFIELRYMADPSSVVPDIEWGVESTAFRRCKRRAKYFDFVKAFESIMKHHNDKLFRKDRRD